MNWSAIRNNDWLWPILVLLSVLGIFVVSPLFLIPEMIAVGLWLSTDNAPKAIAPVKIDGRTQGEWFELIRAMGREEYERLSRPALDGLEDSSEGYGGWDVLALMGSNYYSDLRREFYPEKFCVHCDEECPGDCIEALKYRAMMQKANVQKKKAVEEKISHNKYNPCDGFGHVYSGFSSECIICLAGANYSPARKYFEQIDITNKDIARVFDRPLYEKDYSWR